MTCPSYPRLRALREVPEVGATTRSIYKTGFRCHLKVELQLCIRGSRAEDPAGERRAGPRVRAPRPRRGWPSAYHRRISRKSVSHRRYVPIPISVSAEVLRIGQSACQGVALIRFPGRKRASQHDANGDAPTAAQINFLRHSSWNLGTFFRSVRLISRSRRCIFK